MPKMRSFLLIYMLANLLALTYTVPIPEKPNPAHALHSQSSESDSASSSDSDESGLRRENAKVTNERNHNSASSDDSDSSESQQSISESDEAGPSRKDAILIEITDDIGNDVDVGEDKTIVKRSAETGVSDDVPACGCKIKIKSKQIGTEGHLHDVEHESGKVLVKRSPEIPDPELCSCKIKIQPKPDSKEEYGKQGERKPDYYSDRRKKRQSNVEDINGDANVHDDSSIHAEIEEEENSKENSITVDDNSDAIEMLNVVDAIEEARKKRNLQKENELKEEKQQEEDLEESVQLNKLKTMKNNELLKQIDEMQKEKGTSDVDKAALGLSNETNNNNSAVNESSVEDYAQGCEVMEANSSELNETTYNEDRRKRSTEEQEQKAEKVETEVELLLQRQMKMRVLQNSVKKVKS